jgi:hypothetical protein
MVFSFFSDGWFTTTIMAHCDADIEEGGDHLIIPGRSTAASLRPTLFEPSEPNG